MNFIKYLVLFFFVISCSNNEIKKDKNKYEIINIIYRNFSKEQMEFFVFSPKPLSKSSKFDYKRLLNDEDYADSLHKSVYSLKISKSDSLKKIEKYLEKKTNKKIFAFDLKMTKYHNLNKKEFNKNLIGFQNLLYKFKNSDEVDSLNIDKIFSINNDSLIVFKNELQKGRIFEIKKFDVLVSFSNIIFNEDYSKAILIATRSFNRLDSHSSVYFFRKNNGKWEKIKEQTL